MRVVSVFLFIVGAELELTTFGFQIRRLALFHSLAGFGLANYS
jgi:hypothetical protein